MSEIIFIVSKFIKQSAKYNIFSVPLTQSPGIFLLFALLSLSPVCSVCSIFYCSLVLSPAAFSILPLSPK